MGMFKLLRSGYWYISSKSDPRWNVGGRSEAVGGYAMPPECQKAIDKKKEELGAAPKDLQWGYEKD